MIVVSDSSPLIALLSADRIDLLERLFGTALIPPAVRDEVFGSSSGITDSMPNFIHVESLPIETATRFLRMSLHQGESEAIVLALDKGIDKIILDDKQARETADRLGLSVIGTFGVLMLAKEKGHLDAVRPIMLQIMERINFRIAPNVLNRALTHMNELPV
ncbi:MAG: DUF3368 domain-containing protein [Desulfuromonadales bacterium]